MRISKILLLTAAVVCAAPALTAHAQMGGGMGDMDGSGRGGGQGGGYGGGMGGGGHGGGHHRGNRSQSNTPAQPQGQRPGPVAPPVIPVNMRLSGMVIVSGQAKSLAHTAVISVKPDMSAVYAERGAQLGLDAMTLTGAGDVSLISDARDSGLDSALLVASEASVNVSGGAIATTGKGANAAFVGDAGSKLGLKGVAIATHGADAFGIEAAGGGTVTADTVNVATSADRATALAVQTPGSHATINGGTFVTSGSSSNAFFVRGALEADGAKAATAAADAIVADGAETIKLNDSDIHSAGYGAVLYATRSAPSPEAPLHRTSLVMTGGRLAARRAGFYVTNLRADITLDHVDLHSDGGVLVKSASDQWGPLGRNGGDVHLTVHHQVLDGDFATDVISSIALSLNDNSAFTGRTTVNVDVALDASSTWTLTGDMSVGKLTDAAISGDTVPNINSNGHKLSYDDTHNPALGGKTYQLAGGGQLVPGAL